MSIIRLAPGVAIALVMAVAVGGAEARDNPLGCEHVEGRFEGEFEFTGPGAGAAEGTVTGDLAGTFSAEYFNFESRGNGAIALNGVHTLVVGDPADGNVLVTFDEILLLPDLDPDKVHANARLYVDSEEGTGVYAGTTGLLHTGDGGVDLSTGELSIRYKGKICPAP
jgi:hypothetical protein